MSTIPRATDLAESQEAGYTLPASWYTDPATHHREKERIFACSWQYVGLAELVSEAGQYLTARLGDVPVIVVRDADHILRAYVNVCRHRGSQLVLDAQGKRQAIQCHYHAWTYGLDGCLLAAPGSKAEPEFDRSQFSLIPVQIDCWGPFIFLNPDERALPLSRVLGELPSMVGATGLDLPRIRRRVRHEYEIHANWKVVVDNYLECYHCPTAHPSFSALIDVDDYEITPYEYFSAQTGRVKKSKATKPYTVRDGVEDGFYAFVWPNFMVNIYPGPGNVSLNTIIPIDVDHTLAVYEYCFVDEVDGAEVEEFVAFIDQVQQEDIVLCESVQRGLKSGFFHQGKLMLSRERGLQHFQQLVFRHLDQ